MNANNDNDNGNNNNGREGNEAHEIPADSLSASENDEVRDEKTTSNNNDDAQNGNLPGDGENGNGGREQDVNNNNGVTETDGCNNAKEGDDNAAEYKYNNDAETYSYEGCISNYNYPSSSYTTNNAPQMFEQQQQQPNNNMMYPNNNNNGGGAQSFLPPFDPQQQHSHFDPSAGYHNHHALPPQQQQQQQPLSPMNCLGPPPNLPPTLPPPPPPLPMPPPMTGDPNLDATRQYYEARMREHAMQYANAAAGAAWAAARIACGGAASSVEHRHHHHHLNPMHGHGMPGGFMAPLQPPLQPPSNHHSVGRPSYYTPASGPLVDTNGAMMMSPMNSNQMVVSSTSTGGGPRQQKRTLWNPVSSSENKNCKGRSSSSSKMPKKGGSKLQSEESKSKGQNAAALGETKQSSTTTTPGGEPELSSSGTQNEKKRSKREIRGNDSVSSLGSESRDLSVGRNIHKGNNNNGSSNNNNKRNSKKGNQRRRFNEDTDASPANTTNNNTNGGNKNGNYNGHQRQKRGLHHGHSSRSSFSSFGSGGGGGGSNNPHHSSSGRNKKKNRSQRETTQSGTNGGNDNNNSSPNQPASIHLGGLIGKNGARALHELCSKYRWEMPKYNSIEPRSLAGSADNDGDSNNDITFVITVQINGVELGRGRGGTKVSAKQDASRKALAALVPGVVFDPNGILLDVGKHGEGVAAGGGVSGNNVGLKPLSLDELGPHLASQLAIGGSGNANPGTRSRPTSPDHSESSSISTAISGEVMISGGTLISGGPLSQKLGFQHQYSSPSPAASGGACRFFSSNIYPCASTTSGVSSASDIDETEDENAYYSSRGASVCSTLLHAMWQIDDRIREPPSYVFDLCPSPVNVKGPVAPGAACTKRKKVESPREVAVRMFQCAASLNLYFPSHLGGDKDLSSLMDYWESPLDHLQTKEASPYACVKGESSQSRKRKDSVASQSTLSPHRPQLSDGVHEQQEESPPKSLRKQENEKEEFTIAHKLESISTGSTKRESKHKASAKLLAALFPGCNSMVEVKAEAEAARELYAANKAAESQTKRAKLTTGTPPEWTAGPNKRSSAFSEVDPAENSDNGYHTPSPIPLNEQAHDMKPISLHALSLSEPKEGSKRIKWSDVTTTSVNLDLEVRHLHRSIEDEVDAALQTLQELDEEGRSWAAKDLSSDDVGKIILRRANPDDTDFVHSLLNKNETDASTNALAKKKTFSNTPHESVDVDEIDAPAPESDDIEDNAVDEENNATREDDKRKQQKLLLFGQNSILLVLSRAVALHDPPLGCAILTFSSSNNNEDEGGDLTLCRLNHERHLPRERFVECLETFANNIQCNLDSTACSAGHRDVAADDIRSFLSRSSPSSPLYHRAEDVVAVDCGGVNNGNTNHSQHLQSVKEEDSEEEDDGSEVGGEDVDSSDKKKLDTGDYVRGSSLVKGRPCKPSKRSRVA